MAHDTALLTAKDLPKLPQKEPSFLNAEDIAEEELPHDAAPTTPRPGTLPGRRPLFRN
jgi:hypothetical protein